MNLLQKIESEPIGRNQLQVFYLGQSGYVLKTARTILYIDPYLSDYIENKAGRNNVLMNRTFSPPIDPQHIRKIDAVLCTHSHSDHMDPWTLECIQPSFTLISTERAYEKKSLSLESHKKVFLTLGQSEQVNKVNIRFFPAAHYHLFDESGAPDCVSFLLSIGKRNLFFWGDGVIYEDLIPSLKSIRFDCFFAPINGRDWFREAKGVIGNISARELSELCSVLDIKLLIPNHFDLFEYNGESIDYFQYCMKKFCPEQPYQILKAGNFIEV